MIYCVKMQCAEKRGYVDCIQVTCNCIAWSEIASF